MRKQQGADCQSSDKATRPRWPGSTEEGCPVPCQLLSPLGVGVARKGGEAGSGGRAFCKLSASLSYALLLPPRTGLSQEATWASFFNMPLLLRKTSLSCNSFLYF